MILKPGDRDHEVLFSETYHEQTNEELTDKKVKQIESDDQDLQTILMGLLKSSMLLFYQHFDESLIPMHKSFTTFQNYNPNSSFSLSCLMNGKGIANQNANQNGNIIVATWAEGNGNGNNGNQFDLMAATGGIDEIEEVNAECIWMANLQQASTSASCVEHNGGTVEQHPVTVKETRAYFESIYNNLEIEKVALGYQNPFYLKQAQQKQHSLYNGKVLLEKHEPPVTSNSVPTTKGSKVMENENVIAPGMFRINSFKPSREDKFVPINKARAKKPKKLGSKERLASPTPKISGTIRFGNDHITAILGYGDLQWGSILITMVYFVEGLGHNMFLVGQNCDSDLERLHLYHMDLCGPIRVKSMNEKWYILMIVDDYSRYTWFHFLRSKDETPEVIKTFLKKITDLLQSPVIIVRTDNDIEFKNQGLKKYFDVGISHQTSSVKTPQQNEVIKQRNQKLVEAARTILIFSYAPLFLWTEATATTKTPYELINDIKPHISFLHVFEALCYPKNDREDIGKLGEKGDIGFFIGYSANSCAYRVYNQRTRNIMNVTFDELSTMAFEKHSSKLELQRMTSGQISSGLDLTYASSTITSQKPTECELDLLFEAMYDDYISG
nr:hypothetical protein [Tanacetum cinerariifolium]